MPGVRGSSGGEPELVGLGMAGHARQRAQVVEAEHAEGRGPFEQEVQEVAVASASSRAR